MDYSKFFSTALSRCMMSGATAFRRSRSGSRAFPACGLATRRRVARNVVIWCSNDYLGMGQHPKVVSGAMVETATRVGTKAPAAPATSPALIIRCPARAGAGRSARQRPSLLFTSGYVSNQTGISTIAQLIPKLP